MKENFIVSIIFLIIINFLSSMVYCDKYPTNYDNYDNFLSTCCSIPESNSYTKELLKCTDNSRIGRYSSDESSIAIITMATKAVNSFFKYSFFVNEAFCAMNDYKFFTFDSNSPMYNKNITPMWNKIKIISDGFDRKNGFARNYDYIMWIDADLIITDFGLRIENIINKFPHADIIASEDIQEYSNVINSGSMIIKNTKWSRQFLKNWLNADYDIQTEQERFNYLYHDEKIKSKKKESTGINLKIEILPIYSMNSIYPVWKYHDIHNPILHLWHEINPYRVAVFKRAKQILCTHTSKTGKDSHLSGLVPIYSKDHTIKSYRISLEADTLLELMLETYLKSMTSLISKLTKNLKENVLDLKLITEVSDISLVYANGLDEVHKEKDAHKIRKYNFELLLYSLETFKNINHKLLISHGIGLREWPQLLFLTAKAGQVVVDRGTRDQAAAAIYKVLMLLRKLRIVCKKSQVVVVDQLVARLYVSKGKHELHSGDAHAAKASLQLALQYTHNSTHRSFSQFLKAHIRILLAQSHAEIGDLKKSEWYLDSTAKTLNNFKFSTSTSVVAYNITSSITSYNGEVAYQKQFFGNDNKKLSMTTQVFSSSGSPWKTYNLVDTAYFKRLLANCGLTYLKIKKYDKAYGFLAKSFSHSSPVELDLNKQVTSALKIVNSAKSRGFMAIDQT